MAFAERYINLTTDFGFKRIFGSELNKDLLIGFLNALFAGERVVENVQYKNNENFGYNRDARKAIFDVYCQAADGSRFIVEMQNVYQQFYKDRSVYYSTFPIIEQAQKGDWNYELEPVYTVGILNFAFPEDGDSDAVRREIKLTDIGTSKVFYDKLTFVYVELAKFHKTESQLETLLDKWLFVLKNMQRLMERPAALQERVFRRLFQAAEIATYSADDRKEYEQSRRAYQDIKIAIDTAKNDGRAEGHAEGHAEGLAEGLAKGRAEGIEEGRAEGLEEGKKANAVQSAAAMKRDGMPTSQISKYTGLTESEIERL